MSVVTQGYGDAGPGSFIITQGYGASLSPGTISLTTPSSLTAVAPDTALVFLATDAVDSDIVDDSITIVVNGVTAWASSVAQNGWAGKLVTLPTTQRQITLYSPNGFSYGTTVSVNVTCDVTT